MSTEMKNTQSIDPGVIGSSINDIDLANEDHCIQVSDLNLHYGDTLALKGIGLAIARKRVTAFIGPSGCGKSTLLRCFNRMSDLVPSARIEGRIELDGQNIYDPKVQVAQLRQRVGMVFQKPTRFPRVFMRMSPTVCVCRARRVAVCWTTLWRGRCAVQPCGMR